MGMFGSDLLGDFTNPGLAWFGVIFLLREAVPPGMVRLAVEEAMRRGGCFFFPPVDGLRGGEAGRVKALAVRRVSRNDEGL